MPNKPTKVHDSAAPPSPPLPTAPVPATMADDWLVQTRLIWRAPRSATSTDASGASEIAVNPLTTARVVVVKLGHSLVTAVVLPNTAPPSPESVTARTSSMGWSVDSRPGVQAGNPAMLSAASAPSKRSTTETATIITDAALSIAKARALVTLIAWVIVPLRTRRRRPPPEIHTLPSNPSTTPHGVLSCAAVAGPPSPLLQQDPVPANVMMVPFPSTRRMTWLPVSAMKNPPAAEAARPLGFRIVADVARPPSPLYPGEPVPTAVVITPLDDTARTRWRSNSRK
jgi:hypothetical protein